MPKEKGDVPLGDDGSSVGQAMVCPAGIMDNGAGNISLPDHQSGEERSHSE